MYYNVTRYYNPQWGRFLNADDVSYLNPESINGLNLYAYCGNNPIMRVDPLGTSWFSSIGNWFVNAGKSIRTFFENNWDIILGTGLVIGAIAISVVTFGAGTVVAWIVAGATFGGDFGALGAAVSGGNILQGAITGMFVGALGGISGWAAFAGAAGMSLIYDRINDKSRMGFIAKGWCIWANCWSISWWK